MMQKIVITFVFVLLSALLVERKDNVYAQGTQYECTIDFTVTDQKTGSPLVGAAVLIKGTTRGAFTDEKGRVRLSVSLENEGEAFAIMFSYIGHKPADIEFQSCPSVYDVSLKNAVRVEDFLEKMEKNSHLMMLKILSLPHLRVLQDITWIGGKSLMIPEETHFAFSKNERSSIDHVLVDISANEVVKQGLEKKANLCTAFEKFSVDGGQTSLSTLREKLKNVSRKENTDILAQLKIWDKKCKKIGLSPQTLMILVNDVYNQSKEIYILDLALAKIDSSRIIVIDPSHARYDLPPSMMRLTDLEQLLSASIE
ncbi:MAG: carboxypeptidase-like regulatory domain-containing protein [Deltaproteobacteria bacterium]|nr:carboxypeptidase-like regulatory domain-containing protein [Deltaproteobacteria bacterium]